MTPTYKITGVSAESLIHTVNLSGDWKASCTHDTLTLQTTRTAMDGNGFIVGDEMFEYIFKMHPNIELGIGSVPISKHTIFPEGDCELNLLPAAPCTCEDENTCHCPPDEEFAFQILERLWIDILPELATPTYINNKWGWDK